MSTPLLYVFAISHYCEKARWALDHYGIDYAPRFAPPGLHAMLAKRSGARRSSVPFLVVDGRTIQGSSQIVDWADDAAPPEAPSLTPDDLRDEVLAVEKRLDDVAGVHVRRYYYSEALVEHPATVRPIFTRDLGTAQRLLVNATWAPMRSMMIKGMDLGPDQRLDSRDVLERELAWLDDRLADGRHFLVGDALTRADITAASLLAPLVLPDEHPVYADMTLPPGIAADVDGWRGRASLDWVRQTYSRYRRAAGCGTA